MTTPTWPGVPAPIPQAESDEPGNFALGAIVGGVVAYILLAQDGDGGAVFPFVPICALIGGMLFWTIGIG